MRPLLLLFRLVPLCLLGLLPAPGRAEPIKFDIPAQPGDAALLTFSKQAGVDVLFSYDELHRVQSTAVDGLFESEEALSHLLLNTGYRARRNGRGKYVVTLASRPTGSIRGRLLQPDGTPAGDVPVTISTTSQQAITDEKGQFTFASVLPGDYQLTVRGPNYRPLFLTDVKVQANRLTSLKAQTLQIAGEVTLLEPFVVKASANRVWPGGHDYGVLPLRVAAGNLDLPRSVDDALAFQIYNREQLTRSGVVNLNEFLQRELLDSNGATPQPDLSNGADGTFSGSSNLNLRGFYPDETVILVNGRRMPEVQTNMAQDKHLFYQLPDVNIVPLSMVQQVQVLPASASSIYTGNPVGGVINIVLRPDIDATELTTTYSNALRGFDAPQTSVTLHHGQSLLDGNLRLRLSASYTKIEPATEAELGFIQAHADNLTGPFYRATPNVRSVSGDPFFSSSPATITSVAPGANGAGGLAAFAQREGVPSLDLFQVPDGLVTSPFSTGFGYGRQQKRSSYFGSVVYDATPWLQLGLDGSFSRSVVNRGQNLFVADLNLPASSAFNPFGQDVSVTLNESVPKLGEHYNEARLDFSALVFGVLLKLPADWRVAFDTQYAQTNATYRGLSDVRQDRWQELVDQGLYNPLRDTQVYGPPQEFYDRVLVHYGTPGRFVTMGNYQALDLAVRVTNQALQLPTGLSAVNFGADYRRNHLDGFTDERRFGDGSLAGDPESWTGRTLQRWSVFGEIQAPLLPKRWLPAWLHGVDTDLALRYVGSSLSKESYFAPTAGLKVEFGGGLAFRGSVSSSSRFPTPQLSHRVVVPGGGGGGVDTATIIDSQRGNETYPVLDSELAGFVLSPESALTQTAGLIFQKGKEHRFRASLDFVDTNKTNELVFLAAQQLLDLERIFPERIIRAPLQPGDHYAVGKITTISTGTVNLSSRHSQNWNALLDYTWTKCFDGALNLNGRLVYFQKFDRKLAPGEPVTDELHDPDPTASSLLKYRASVGAGWSNRNWGLGVEGHYYHSRILPLIARASQGSDRIGRHYQIDAYVQGDLSRWLPGRGQIAGRTRYGLHGQLRVNNLLNADFPRYSYDSTFGVQPYGDWRGRTYSVSLTATF